MDPVSAVLLAAIALVYPVGIGGAFYGSQWLETRRVARTKRDWADFAARQGLVGGARETGNGFQIAYAGSIRGRSVTLTTQSPAPKGGWTEARVMLHPPMDLGLSAVGKISFGYDNRFSYDVHTDEPGRTEALLDHEVRAQCMRLSGIRWVADDLGVRMRFEMFVPDPMSLSPTVSAAIDLVETIDRARARVGPAAALRDEALAWQRFAEGAGFAFGTAPLYMRGTLDGIEVSAFSRRVDRATYGLGAEARFQAPLGGALALTPTAPGALAPWLGTSADHPGTEDWQVGDAAFDAAFIVRAHAPERLAALVPPPLRERILHVHERTPLVVDDLGVRVVSAHLPPAAEIPRLLRDLADLAAQLEANVRGRTGGPYR